MKIDLYLVDYYKENKDNGLNTYIKELGSRLKISKNINTTYFWIDSPNLEIKIDELNLIKNIYIPRFTKIKGENAHCYIAKTIALEISTSENALVHLNWINHCSIAWYLKKEVNCKIILTKHCLPWRDFVTSQYDEFIPINTAYLKNKHIEINNLQLRKELIAYNFIDHIITVTNCAKFSLNHLFKIDNRKISVIPNGLQTNVLLKKATEKSVLRKKYGFSLTDKIILFAGNVNERKGIMDIIKVFDSSRSSLFNNIKIVIAGSGNHSKILSLIKSRHGKIILTGSLDKKTLYDFYAFADFGIAPSYAEQCSYTVIEMMQFGLPTIVSDVDGLKEMVNDDCGLKIKVDFKKTGASINAKDLKEKISFYLENPTEAKRLATNAKNYALKHFTAERMAKETIAVYEKVLAEKPMVNNAQKVFPPKSTAAFISIILICYNEEKYLAECLNSILTNNYANFEIIVVNDGSTDGTEKIIQSFKDERLVYLKNEENKGITFSLNKATKQARGKYIAYINASDKMLANRLQLEVSYLEENPAYGMVGSHYHIIDAFGMPINKIETNADSDDLKLMMLFSNPFLNSSITVRADIAKKIKFSSKFEYCSDYNFYLQVAKSSKVKILPITLMEHRPIHSNTIADYQKLKQQNVIKLLARELDNLKIPYTAEELMLHAAVSFGYGAKYFNSKEKIVKLDNWLDKIFSSVKLMESYNLKKLRQFRKELKVNVNLN